MKNLLFICSENKLRSPTAEVIFAETTGIEALSAGTNSDAETPLSGDLIEWADIIFVMENAHKKKVTNKYTPLLQGKKLVVLAIADNYEFMQAELVELLKRQVSRSVSF